MLIHMTVRERELKMELDVKGRMIKNKVKMQLKIDPRIFFINTPSFIRRRKDKSQRLKIELITSIKS